MLSYLAIRDFAIIDELRVEFGEGFSVLTGETGAGKTILVQALHLLLGGRATSDMIRTDKDAAEVEGEFHSRCGTRIRDTLAQQGLDGGEAFTIRRIISRSGRNRAFVNGRAVTLAQLEEVTRGLIDISGQHEHVQLSDEDTHREVLDEFGGLGALRGRVRAAVLGYRSLQSELKALDAEEREGEERKEFLRFSLHRIEEVDPRPGEDEELQRERSRLKNAEKLAGGLREARDLTYDREGSAVELLGRVAQLLGSLEQFDPKLAELRQRCEELQSGVEDLSRESETAARGLENDPQRLDQIEERLVALKGLMRTHGPDLAAVCEKRIKLLQESEALEGQGSRREELAGKVAEGEREALRLAQELSRERRRVAVQLGERMVEQLHTLAMKGAQVEVEVDSAEGSDGLEEWGIDRVRFLLSANPGEEVRPLSRVASGGELSRVLLALKVVLSRVDPVPTYVFDEVDSGVGGAVAEVIGSKLAAISAGHQVLCITHLPQIAAWAARHYSVRKHKSGSRTVSEVAILDEEAQRIEEVARMAGGRVITEEARNHARELLSAAKKTRRRL